MIRPHATLEDAVDPPDPPQGRGETRIAAGGTEAEESRTDAEAARATLGGDRGAFAHFVRRYQRPVFALLKRMLRRAEDAEDLTQETFLKAYRALGQWDTQRPFQPWIYQIARNAALSAMRRKGALIVPLMDEEGMPAAEPADPKNDGHALRERLHNAQQLERVRAALDTLGAEEAALFHMRHADEMSFREIAEALGMRENTVTVRLHRLRLRLRELLRTGEQKP